MKITSIARVSSVAMVSALALTACGSSSNDGGSDKSSNGGSAAVSSSDCGKGTIKASGSTAQKNAMQQATQAYKGSCADAQVNYTGSGSGQGITDFIAKQVAFAGSDSALSKDKGEPEKAKAACNSEALNLPMVTGPIAVAYNVKGVDKLNLTPDLIAKIFSGKITKWDDAEIAKANPGVKLPSTKITVFFRSDKSGTTDNFTKYMNTTAPDVWTEKHDKAWKGKVGQAKDKSAGVSQAVSSTDGGITYVEWSYAIENKLNMAKVNNVELSAESAAKAVEAAKIEGTGKDLTLKLDYKTTASGAYPIVLVTYEVVCSKYADATTGKNVKAFLKYMASDSFQSTLTKVGSAPLPKSIQTKVQDSVNSIS